jgi:hypothetical protein
MEPQVNFKLHVLYAQVSVFVAGLRNPFNGWSQQHVEQGFAWRKESVAFKTIDETGDLFIRVLVRDEFVPQRESQRIIRVPFVVPESCMIEITSIADGRTIKVPAGDYSLYFETYLNGGNAMIGYFTFCTKHIADSKIVRADSEVKAGQTCTMAAEPA